MLLLATNLDGPPATPWRGGLLGAAQPGDASVRWEDGVVCWPDAVPGYRLAQLCTTDTDDHGLDTGEPLPYGARPILIQSRVRTRRSTVAEMSARARRQLDAVTGRALARELWTGTGTRLDPYGLPGPQAYANPTEGAAPENLVNPYLTAPGGIALPAAPLVEAVAAVEARTAELVTTGPVYLHLPLVLVLQLAQQLETRGELLYTPAGSIVVPDPGYPNTAPRTVYGTGPVTVWTGPISVIDDPAQVVSPRDNTAEVWAERPALAVFDPQTLVGCPVEA